MTRPSLSFLIEGSSCRLMAQEISLDSFAMLYPFADQRLRKQSVTVTRALTIRAGIASGPIIGQLLQLDGKAYAAAILGGRVPLIWHEPFRTLGAALDCLIVLHETQRIVREMREGKSQ